MIEGQVHNHEPGEPCQEYKIGTDLIGECQLPLLAELRERLAFHNVKSVIVEDMGRSSEHIDWLDTLTVAVIDLEWDPDGKRTGTPGMLEVIGVGGPVGNEFQIRQYHWNKLDGYSQSELRSAIAKLIARVQCIYHTAMADLKKFAEMGFQKIAPADHFRIDDLMLAHHAILAEGATKATVEFAGHGLDDLTAQGITGMPPGYKGMRKWSPQPAEYNQADLLAPYIGWKWAQHEFLKNPLAEMVYEDMSRAYMIELQWEQESRGIAVDKKAPHLLLDKYSRTRDQAEKLAQAYTGGLMSLSSPDDLKMFLYNVEGLPPQREKTYSRNQQGKLVTGKDAIATLRRLFGTDWDPDDEPTLEDAWENLHPEGGNGILEARYLYAGAQQALSHYILPCFYVDKKGNVTGLRERVYPEVRIHVQETGRHSYVAPDHHERSGMAAQQLKGRLVPYQWIDGGEIPELQQLIVPERGTTWIGHDWSNIETWLLGGLANDQIILKAKAENWDTHTVNFCDMTGTARPPILTKKLHKDPSCEAWRTAIAWKGDDDTRRTFAKRFVYRLHYRGQAKNAGDIPGAASLKFDVPKLVAASEAYLTMHHWLVAYWDKIENEARNTGMILTFLGRPRVLTNTDGKAMLREASNQPMQGGVADIYILTALAVKRACPWAWLVYGAHDSNWWGMPTERVPEFQEKYKPIVEQVWRISKNVEMSFPGSYKRREAPG